MSTIRELTCVVCPNGCSLTLTQGGEVAVQGTMMINGKPLEEIVRSMVAAAMAGQGG